MVSPRAQVYSLLFAISQMCHISKSSFYTTWSQTFTEQYYPLYYCWRDLQITFPLLHIVPCLSFVIF